MPAAFSEVWSLSGVDEQAKGGPGMIVPLHGSNIIRLIGGPNLSVMPERDVIKVEKIDAQDIVAIQSSVIALGASLDPDIFFRKALELSRALSGSPRFFKISPRHMTGVVGINVLAKNSRGIEAKLRVVALGKRTVRLAIRHVQVSDGKGGLINHSKVSFDAQAMCAQMNSVWTPQANVVFDLVSSKPAPIVDESEIATLLRLTLTDHAPLPQVVSIQKFRSIFKRLKDESPKADLTMFLVEQAEDKTLKPLGVTETEDGFALISDNPSGETMAHEAGHYLGSFRGQRGGWVPFGHEDGTSRPPLLMRMSGGGLKIPFDDTIAFFNKNS